VVFSLLEYALQKRLPCWLQELLATTEDETRAVVEEATSDSKLLRPKNVDFFGPWEDIDDVKRPGLYDYRVLLGWIDAHKDSVVAAKLGQNWQKLFEKSVRLRNDLAHGNVSVENLQSWRNTVSRMVEVLPLVQRLQELLEGGVPDGESVATEGGT
jgi:hypothetical protein